MSEIYTNCLASSLKVRCLNESCCHVEYQDPPAPANVNVADDNRERNTDYAVNVLYTLGFLVAGDGALEAGRVCGLLGLPGGTWMEGRSYPTIEDRIGPTIRSLGDEIVLENLIEEARLSMEACTTQDDNDFLLWRRSLTDKSFVLSNSKKPRLTVSNDMGWQQKGSGSRVV